tara:strand:- start:52 stop:462 length:411 start_codon:yes stop_codon:yes gene_type:complete
MNYTKFIILTILIIIFIIFILFFSKNKELFRGRKGKRRRNKSGRRKWYGQKYGYRYSPPPRFRLPFLFFNPFNAPYYDSPIYNFPYSTSYRNPFIYVNQFCPTGCSNLGKGRWGCTNPGYGAQDCQFASDCAVCGY